MYWPGWQTPQCGIPPSCLQGDSETVVKRALSVLAELWRRQVWRDVRTVNVLASATAHESPSIMQASLKFFLGQDVIAEEEEEEEEDLERPAAPTKDDVYKAYHKVCEKNVCLLVTSLDEAASVVQGSPRSSKRDPCLGHFRLQKWREWQKCRWKVE
jgi:hypothetical protein